MNRSFAGLGFDSVGRVDLRIVFYEDSTGTRGVGNFDDFEIDGSVVAVPEPSYALLALGAVAFFIYRFRRCA